MIRISIDHINKFGPLKFPATQAQIFLKPEKVPRENLTQFYQHCIDLWLQKNPDRQVFEWHKDICDDNAMPNGSKVYTPTPEALGQAGPVEEEL